MNDYRSKLMSLRTLLAVTVLGLGLGLSTPGIAAGNLSDSQVTTRVKAALANVKSLKGANISVKTVDGVVTLSGTVSDPHAKFAAVAAVVDLEGVRILDDQLKTETDHNQVADAGTLF